jgi:hypothetical protein
LIFASFSSLSIGFRGIAVDTYYTVTVPTTYTVVVPDPAVYYYVTPVAVCIPLAFIPEFCKCLLPLVQLISDLVNIIFVFLKYHFYIKLDAHIIYLLFVCFDSLRPSRNPNPCLMTVVY